jgi:hypothetical protein
VSLMLSVLNLLLLFGQSLWVRDQAATATLSAGTAAYDQAISQVRALDSLFIEHPELRKYFYDGAPLGNEELEQARVFAACEYLLDTFDFLLTGLKRFRDVWPEEDRVLWHAWMRDVFRTSPTLSGYLDKKHTWYSDELKVLRTEALRPAN